MIINALLVDNSHVTRRQRPVSGNKELVRLQQEEEEFWQLAEGFNMSKPGSENVYVYVGLYYQLFCYHYRQLTLRQKSSTATSVNSGGRTATPSASSVNDTTSNTGPIPEVVTPQEFINYSSPVNNVCVIL